MYVLLDYHDLLMVSKIPLRRMVYLVLKELTPMADEQHVIMVMSSLLKDINSKTDLYRANAIRVMTGICDVRINPFFSKTYSSLLEYITWFS